VPQRQAGVRDGPQRQSRSDDLYRYGHALPGEGSGDEFAVRTCAIAATTTVGRTGLAVARIARRATLERRPMPQHRWHLSSSRRRITALGLEQAPRTVFLQALLVRRPPSSRCHPRCSLRSSSRSFSNSRPPCRPTSRRMLLRQCRSRLFLRCSSKRSRSLRRRPRRRACACRASAAPALPLRDSAGHACQCTLAPLRLLCRQRLCKLDNPWRPQPLRLRSPQWCTRRIRAMPPRMSGAQGPCRLVQLAQLPLTLPQCPPLRAR
jgi:hypothetical protein